MERELCELGSVKHKKLRKSFKETRNLGLLRANILDLRDVVMRREEDRREREFVREKGTIETEEKRRNMEFRKERRGEEREEAMKSKQMELEERELKWARREYERRVRLEMELDEVRRRKRRRRMEEKREEEEMQWREKMLGFRNEHEKSMMKMHADASQNQLQILGVMARLICQVFGSANDGLGGGLVALPPQVLQILQHPGGLGDSGKPNANSPSEFM